MMKYSITWLGLLCCVVALAHMSSAQSDADQRDQNKNRTTSPKLCQCYKPGIVAIHAKIFPWLSHLFKYLKAIHSKVVSSAEISLPSPQKMIIGALKYKLRLMTQLAKAAWHVMRCLERRATGQHLMKLWNDMKVELGSNKTSQACLIYKPIQGRIFLEIYRKLGELFQNINSQNQKMFTAEWWKEMVGNMGTEVNLAKHLNIANVSTAEANRNISGFMNDSMKNFKWSITVVKPGKNNSSSYKPNSGSSSQEPSDTKPSKGSSESSEDSSNESEDSSELTDSSSKSSKRSSKSSKSSSKPSKRSSKSSEESSESSDSTDSNKS